MMSKKSGIHWAYEEKGPRYGGYYNVWLDGGPFDESEDRFQFNFMLDRTIANTTAVIALVAAMRFIERRLSRG